MSRSSHRQLILQEVLVALLTWLMSGSSGSAQTVAAQRVVVRSYNTSGLPLSMLDDAESTAGQLLREAGIDSSWRNCRTTDGPSSQAHDLCTEVLNASEVIVRIVDAPPAITDVEVLGYSHVDAYRRQGTLATVFADRVRALAAALQVDDATLLGRAITHEVGHLLLGTLEHSETGLMRGAWNTAGRRRSDWVFSAAEAARMRAGLEARVLSPPIAVARAQSLR
jgi:hypothetical protein